MLIQAPFATVSDLEKRWRALLPSEVERATELLADASGLILDEYPNVNRVPAEQAPHRARTLKRVVCAMVKRAMMPDGGDGAPIAQFQQAAGPFSVNVKPANPMGDLYLTASERKSLRGPQVAFTVSMNRYDQDDTVEDDEVYVPDDDDEGTDPS